MMNSTTPLELKGGGMVGLQFKIVKIEIGLFCTNEDFFDNIHVQNKNRTPLKHKIWRI